MLFKYIFGAVALAVSVIASDDSADLSLPKGLSFDIVIRDTEKFKNSLITAARKEAIPEVINNLNEIYKPVSEFCNKFHSAGRLDKNAVSKEAEFFIKFLKGFEAILDAISQHAKVFDASHGILTKFNADFNLLVDDCKKYQVDLRHASSGITFNVSIWVRFGLVFITAI